MARASICSSLPWFGATLIAGSPAAALAASAASSAGSAAPAVGDVAVDRSPQILCHDASILHPRDDSS